MRSWTWVGRYAVVLLAAALLGAGIGELEVFKQTTLGTRKLHAAKLATFLGYGGALVIFVLLARRATEQFRRCGNGTAHLAFIVPPLTALLVSSAGYHVVLAILDPFLGSAYRDLYNWAFVLGISASAIWLVVALYWHSDGLVALLKVAGPDLEAAVKTCGSCGTTLQESARFCAGCGKIAGA